MASISSLPHLAVLHLTLLFKMPLHLFLNSVQLTFFSLNDSSSNVECQEVRAPTQGQQYDEGPSADQTVEQRSVLTHRLHEGVASERRIRWVCSLTFL